LLLLELGMCRGGDRSFPGGKKPGPKPNMDEESIAKRQKRQESKERTAERKAADAAAAEQEEQAEQQRALLREKYAGQAMCIRRKYGSARIADAKAAAALDAAAPAAAASAAQPQKGTLLGFFSKPSAPEA
jgi:hypothetical protein